MKKFVIGLLVGILLSVTSSVFADDIAKLIGKQVDAEFPVLLNGVALKNKAPAIEGASYAPVREIAEAIGLTVDFKDNTVLLSTYKTNISEVPKMTEEQQISDGITVDTINSSIEGYQSMIGGYKVSLDVAKSSRPEAVPAIEVKIQELKDKIAELEKKKAELTKTP